MANLKIPKSEEDVKKLTIAGLRKEYKDITSDYTKMLDNEYVYCPHCGNWLSSKNFYSNKNNPSGLEHFACKACILDMCTDYDKKSKIRIDNKDKTIETFKRLNWYFNSGDYNAQLQAISDAVSEKNRGTAVQQLIVMISSLPQYRGLSFKDSDFGSDDINSEEDMRIVQKTIKSGKKHFGVGYSNEDLMVLESELQDWITRYPCETKSQEILFKRICCKTLEADKLSKAGKDTKEVDKTIQDLMGSLAIKPSQSNTNALVDSQTFGQLIQKWEEEKPIPEPEDEFKDIDRIGLLIDVFFKGHLSKMMGLKNGFSSLYENFIKKYTVTKPQYDEDTDSEELFNQIFGSKAVEENE